MESIKKMYEIILERKSDPVEGSYTCYLFDKGLDKILKKVGEECSETIIAAKNGDNAELCDEIADLLYHTMVLMAQAGLPLETLDAVLENRRQKICNLKTAKETDRNT